MKVGYGNISVGDLVEVFSPNEFYSDLKNQLRSDISPFLVEDVFLYGPFYIVKSIGDNRIVFCNKEDSRLEAVFPINLIKRIIK